MLIRNQPLYEFATKLQLDTSFLMKVTAIIKYKINLINDNTSTYDSSVFIAIQNLESQLQLQCNQIAVLEKSKSEAVATENYTLAMEYKQQIKVLVNPLLDMVCDIIYLSILVYI